MSKILNIKKILLLALTLVFSLTFIFATTAEKTFAVFDSQSTASINDSILASLQAQIITLTQLLQKLIALQNSQTTPTIIEPNSQTSPTVVEQNSQTPPTVVEQNSQTPPTVVEQNNNPGIVDTIDLIEPDQVLEFDFNKVDILESKAIVYFDIVAGNIGKGFNQASSKINGEKGMGPIGKSGNSLELIFYVKYLKKGKNVLILNHKEHGDMEVSFDYEKSLADRELEIVFKNVKWIGSKAKVYLEVIDGNVKDLVVYAGGSKVNKQNNTELIENKVKIKNDSLVEIEFDAKHLRIGENILSLKRKDLTDIQITFEYYLERAHEGSKKDLKVNRLEVNSSRAKVYLTIQNGVIGEGFDLKESRINRREEIIDIVQGESEVEVSFYTKYLEEGINFLELNRKELGFIRFYFNNEK